MTKLFIMVALALACASEGVQRDTLILFGGMMLIAWAISELGD